MAKKAKTSQPRRRGSRRSSCLGGVLLLGVARDPGPEADEEAGGSTRRAGSADASAAADRTRRDAGRRGAVVDRRCSGRRPYVAGVALPGATVVKVAHEPARIVHALRGQGSVRAAGRRDGAAAADGDRTAPPARRSDADIVDARQHRSGRRAPATADPGRHAAADRLRDDHGRRQAQQLSLKQQFPTADPIFVLVSLEEEAGEDRRRRRLLRRRADRHAHARQEADAGQHRDRRSLRAEARLHRLGSRRRSRASRRPRTAAGGRHRRGCTTAATTTTTAREPREPSAPPADRRRSRCRSSPTARSTPRAPC